MTNVSPLRSVKTEQFSSVTTVDSPAASVPGALTAAHISAIEARGLDPELLARLGVGASAKLGGDSIAIPYHEGESQVGCKHRSMTGEKRFVQDVGSKQIFYNFNCLLDETLKDHPLIITEGEADCWAALQAGFPRVVSVPGGAPMEQVKSEGRKYAFIDHAWHLLKDCQTIILATDSDEPGENLRTDLSIRLGAFRCKWVRYPRGCKDLNDALREYGEKGVRASIDTAAPMKIHGYFELDELPPETSPRAHDCGMINLGEHYKLRLGDLCVVTGVPGHGKSSFINEICCRMTQNHGWKTVFASFEQAPGTDHRRALRSFYNEKLEKMMSPQEMIEADAWIREHFGFIKPDLEDSITLDWMLSTMEQAVLRKEAQIAVIDPWNEMDHTRPPDMSLTEYVGYAIKEFKKFARRLNVHLIIAAHPAKMQRSKDGKYPIPSLYDIADSAHWANKPDVGIVIHREDLTVNDTLIKVAKVRYSTIGVPGEVHGAWDVARTRYTIIEPEAMR